MDDSISVQGYTSVFSAVATPLAALSSLLSAKESCAVCLARHPGHRLKTPKDRLGLLQARGSQGRRARPGSPPCRARERSEHPSEPALAAMFPLYTDATLPYEKAHDCGNMEGSIL